MTHWFSTPAADGQNVYVEADSGVLAFDQASGKRVWSSPIDSWGGARNMLVRQGAVYAASAGPIYSLDAASGAVRWRRDDLRGPADPSYAVSAMDERAWYVGTRDLRVLSLDLNTGATRWQVAIGGGWLDHSVVRGLTVSGDTLYAASERCLNANCYQVAAVIMALDRATGAELWRYQSAGVASDIAQNPVVAGRLLVASDVTGNSVFAVDRFTGAEVWRAKGLTGFLGPFGPPVVVGDTVYSGSGDTRVYAINLHTGAVLWSTGTRASIDHIAVCGRYVLAQNQSVVAIDRATGRSAGTALRGEGEDFPVSDLVVAGNRAFVAGTKKLAAIRCD